MIEFTELEKRTWDFVTHEKPTDPKLFKVVLCEKFSDCTIEIKEETDKIIRYKVSKGTDWAACDTLK